MNYKHMVSIPFVQVLDKFPQAQGQNYREACKELAEEIFNYRDVYRSKSVAANSTMGRLTCPRDVIPHLP